jgi:uncharacterized protein YndB with AHSA1/START domain
MKWVLVVLIALALAAAVVAVIGARLPKSHVASRQARLSASPEAVWRVLTDVEAFPSWRGDVKGVRRLPDRQGLACWVEEGKFGTMTLSIERADAPRLLVTRVADADQQFGGTWTYELTPAEGGSTLTITENGEVYNPLFRFMARFVFGHEATMTAYLKALDARISEARRAAL